MKRNRYFIIGIVAVCAITFLSFTLWYINKPEELLLQGEVEATTLKVASKLVGRLDSISVKEGDQVKKGQLLFILRTPELDAKLKQAQSARNAAGAQSSKANAGARQEEIAMALNMWKKAEAAYELAEKTNSRVKNLYAEGVVPQQKLDESETNLKASRTTADAAKAQYEMAMKGARSEDKNAAASLVDQASGVVSEVESYLSESKQYAPIDGEISNVIAERGELMSAGFPVISMVDLNDIWVSFNIREDLLSKIKMGKTITVKIPALNNLEVKLKVSYMSAQASYATWSATRTTGDFDRKTFEVRLRPVDKVEGLRPGMSALVDWKKI